MANSYFVITHQGLSQMPRQSPLLHDSYYTLINVQYCILIKLILCINSLQVSLPLLLPNDIGRPGQTMGQRRGRERQLQEAGAVLHWVSKLA